MAFKVSVTENLGKDLAPKTCCFLKRAHARQKVVDRHSAPSF